jgi:hypothetical protein
VLGYRRHPFRPSLVIGSLVALVVAAMVAAVVRSAVIAVHQAVAAPGPAGGTTAATGWPGATRIESGAPVGYADTETGAVQAATNYEALEQGDLITDPAGYRAALGAVLAPDWVNEGTDQIERTLAGAASVIAAAHSGRTVRLRDAGLGYHVDAFSPARAEVSVWGAVAFGIDGEVPATVTTHTVHYSLQWLGDWKIAGRGPDRPGPEAGPPAGQPVTATLPSELRSYRGYHDVP